MLNDEELAAFLALLSGFMTNAGLSMATTAALLGTSPSSLSRWYNPKEGKRNGAARWIANPIIQKVGRFDAANEAHNLYARLTGMSQSEKLAILKEVLQNNQAWA